ncbi:MAG: hypothetical protein GY854_26490 [Deltaproteobacteria bacterium]|nr:hypothetical protein [Deltaproteobacteria bacterium]
MSIGNEIDVFLGLNPANGDVAAWDNYIAFYEQAAAYVQSVMPPGTRIGVNLTYEVLYASDIPEGQWLIERLERLKAASDVVMLNYYPLKKYYANNTDIGDCSNVPVEPPCQESYYSPFDSRSLYGGKSLPAANLERMLSYAEGKPLVIQEAGYPSAVELCSSEEKKATFMAYLMNALADAGPRVQFVSWFSAYDYYRNLSDPDCQTLAQYLWQGVADCLDDDPSKTAEVCAFEYAENALENGCGVGDLMSIGFAIGGETQEFNAFLSTCGLNDHTGATQRYARAWYALYADVFNGQR